MSWLKPRPARIGRGWAREERKGWGEGRLGGVKSGARSGETAISTPELKKNWTLTEGAFQQLLRWLDEGASTGGARYIEIRRRLVQYFDRRGCAASDELADETLNRAARKLAEVGTIENVAPPQYCYVLAKFVFLEYIRRPGHKESSFDDTTRSAGLRAKVTIAYEGEAGAAELERNLGQLGRCLKKLPAPDQELIIQYYEGDKRAKIEKRSRLAEQFGVTLNALSIRACRIRNKLEECVRKSGAGDEVLIPKTSYTSGSQGPNASER